MSTNLMATSAVATTKRMRYIEAIESAIWEEMERDETVFTLGQGVSIGGFFGKKGQKTLAEQFGTKRVRDSGITEAFMAGCAAGAAMVGMRPIIQMGFAGFSLIAGDEIYHKLAKWRYMHGGKFELPAVIRLPGGHQDAAGPEHSNSYEVLGMHMPGLKVVVPGTAADAKGLLKAAVRDPNPVLFHEVRSLNFTKGEVPTDPDFIVPIGVAEVVTRGNDLTIVTYGHMRKESVAAAERLSQEGISAEVIDLKSLVPLDYPTVFESVAKTKRAMVVNEAALTAGPASEIATRIYEEMFSSLAAPVARVCAPDVPAPQTIRLEAMMRPNPDQIVEAARDLVKY
ncbi:pyruvate dehydrogenase E1 component beta subunit [Rhodococcus rhodochrous J45]|uniref:3-methyl-2-oxobutanoate dehydrogenase (2-methylpropanoyl-transferring) n=1 Tax=Rhodococcus rhodochrous J45 TaxID=935266 RepID=A0A562DJ27_RHORH|nr:transketolase C-terminal domain-containing protein [Rhodococcus rhodochrous]TWH09563.1 pyruvate dehydrogenase E1 component beta subunit [Rhodococcus rhodochrous J45]